MIAIQREIIRDENGDPKSVNIPWTQYQEIAKELGLPDEDLVWSPEKLGEEAQKMVNETDPIKKDEMMEKIIAGFYGEPYAANS